jgi:peptidoglycan hydrolase CwlO-like protein
MLKKIIVTLCTIFLLLAFTSCSNSEKSKVSDNTDTTKKSATSISQFKKDYRKICDSVDADLSDEIDNTNFKTISIEEFEDLYDANSEEYERIGDEFNDLEVPESIKDDWEEYLDLGYRNIYASYELKEYFIEYLQIRDDRIEATANNDTVLLDELQQDEDLLTEQIESITDAGDERKAKQDEIRDNLGLGECSAD